MWNKWYNNQIWQAIPRSDAFYNACHHNLDEDGIDSTNSTDDQTYAYKFDEDQVERIMEIMGT